MRNLKFILSAVAILLAGAVAAGLAAWGVVAPCSGEVHSAGAVTIPTVLGQTAEEVLFSPWYMYGTQPLRHLTEEELLSLLELYELGETWEEVSTHLSELEQDGPIENGLILLFNSFNLIQPVDIPWRELFSNLECNDQISQIFLKDLPATAHIRGDQTGTPVTLSLALGATPNTSFSLLIRPAQPYESTEDEQAVALARVEDDLRRFLLRYDPSYYETTLGGPIHYDSETGIVFTEMQVLLQDFYNYYTNIEESLGIWPPLFYSVGGFMGTWLELNEWLTDILGDPYAAPMDELLSAVESFGICTIQIVTTQQQIVVLFTESNGSVFGVYYDIQLGCYSGVGVMG